MATTYTELLQLPKHATTDPFDITLINNMADLIDAAIAKAYRGNAANGLADNNHFPAAVNQRGKTATTAWQHSLDRWIARSTGISIAIDATGLHLNSTETGNIFLYQKIKIPSAQMLGKTYTLAVCDGVGNLACKSITLPDKEPTSWQTIGTIYVGNIYASIIHTGSGENGFCISIGRITSSTDEAVIYWVDLFPGSYTLKNLPNHHQREDVVELMNCLRYFRIYATAAARPAHGLDCSPPMRTDEVSQGTISINGKTYYYNSADL